jgi:hypothetical protein
MHMSEVLPSPGTALVINRIGEWVAASCIQVSMTHSAIATALCFEIT